MGSTFENYFGYGVPKEVQRYKAVYQAEIAQKNAILAKFKMAKAISWTQTYFFSLETIFPCLIMLFLTHMSIPAHKNTMFMFF